MSIDLSKKVSSFNQLWLRWERVVHHGNGIITLVNPIFFGPVLDDCDPMEPSGHIQLDLTNHYLLIIPRPYYVKLEWEGFISQDKKEIKFKKITLHDSDLGKLSLLKDGNKILLDCTDQTSEARQEGRFKVAFDAMVFNSLGQPYDFTK